MDAKIVSLLNLSPSQLRKAADLKDRIDALMRELGQILDGGASMPGQRVSVAANNRPTGKRTMSAEGRRRIAEAARARWARVRGENGKMPDTVTSNGGPKKRTMSAAARRKIAAAARARWAKVKAAAKA